MWTGKILSFTDECTEMIEDFQSDSQWARIFSRIIKCRQIKAYLHSKGMTQISSSEFAYTHAPVFCKSFKLFFSFEKMGALLAKYRGQGYPLFSPKNKVKYNNLDWLEIHFKQTTLVTQCIFFSFFLSSIMQLDLIVQYCSKLSNLPSQFLF